MAVNGNVIRMGSSSFFSKLKIVAIIILFLLISMGIFSATYTVETGTVGVLSTFGKYHEDTIEPGLHLKFPMIQKIQILDVKLQSANYIGRKDIPDKKGVINKPYIAVLDNKNLPIGIDLTVMYSPKFSEASNILGKYGVNYFDKLINPNIRDVVRDVIGKYPAEQIAADRTKISEELKMLIGLKFEKMPFDLNEVSLRNIQLPKIVLKKVEEVQIAKQEEQKLGMVEKQAQMQQKIKTTQANTRLIEVTTKAKADAEKQKIEADAKAYRVKVEAEAVAVANVVIAKSITPELIKYKAIEKWSGIYPKLLLQGSDSDTILQLPKIDE